MYRAKSRLSRVVNTEPYPFQWRTWRLRCSQLCNQIPRILTHPRYEWAWRWRWSWKHTGNAWGLGPSRVLASLDSCNQNHHLIQVTLRNRSKLTCRLLAFTTALPSAACVSLSSSQMSLFRNLSSEFSALSSESSVLSAEISLKASANVARNLVWAEMKKSSSLFIRCAMGIECIVMFNKLFWREAYSSSALTHMMIWSVGIIWLQRLIGWSHINVTAFTIALRDLYTLAPWHGRRRQISAKVTTIPRTCISKSKRKQCGHFPSYACVSLSHWQLF